MESLIQDVRFSLRLMRKRPGMTVLAIVALVFGIGLNTAIFTVFNAVVLRPLPVFQPDRLFWLHSKVNQTGSPLGTSYPDYLDWKSQSRSFDSIAAMYAVSFTLTGSGPPEHLKGTAISASGFRTWGINIVLGRDFSDEDDRPGANRVAVLDYLFWQRKFGGDPGVLNKALTLDDKQFTIIGVLQPTPLAALKYADVYVANGPLINAHIMERDTRWFFPVGRLKPQVTQEQAQAEMDLIAARIAGQYPATNKDIGIRVQSMVEQLTADGRKPLSLLMVASGLIFLLAAVNVMTVLVGSTAERGQELSVRLALGATRASLLRQLFAQALMFGLMGGVLGLLLAKLAVALFLGYFPAVFLRFQETNIDLVVVLVTVAAALLASVIATVLPAVYAFKLSAGTRLIGQQSWLAPPKYRRWPRSVLVLFEVSLASALSLVSGLLFKSLYEVEKVDLGFNPSHVFSFQINPPLGHNIEPAQQIELSRAVLEKLIHLPGMASTSGISSLPLTTQGQVNTLEVDAQSPLFGQKILVEDESILPGFFQTMRLPLSQGRDFSDADHEGTSPVVIVDDVLAAKLWPGQDPVGKRLHMSLVRGGNARWLEVIGIAQEIKHFGPERNPRWMQVYVPQYQDPAPALSFVVNTMLPASGVREAAEQSLHEVGQDLLMENFQPMDAYLDSWLSSRKVSVLLLGAFAGVGITLGAIGVYGVVANSALERRRELAVRMALGATPFRAISLVTRLSLFATLAGIVVGSGVVVSLMRLLNSFLFGITALDPVIYALSACILIVIAVGASLMPAMRLLSFNIQEILRQ